MFDVYWTGASDLYLGFVHGSRVDLKKVLLLYVLIKMNSTILEKYLNENERLLNTEDYYDVKIHVGIKPNIKEFHAHASIICTHCPFFSNA